MQHQFHICQVNLICFTSANFNIILGLLDDNMLAWFTLHCLCKIKSFSHYIEMQNFLALICALFHLSKKFATHTYQKSTQLIPDHRKTLSKCYPTLLTWCCSLTLRGQNFPENKWLNFRNTALLSLSTNYDSSFVFHSVLPLEINLRIKTVEDTYLHKYFWSPLYDLFKMKLKRLKKNCTHLMWFSKSNFFHSQGQGLPKDYKDNTKLFLTLNISQVNECY